LPSFFVCEHEPRAARSAESGKCETSPNWRHEGPGAAAACRPAGSGGVQACARLRWRGIGRRGWRRRGSAGARGHAVARGAVVARACWWVGGGATCLGGEERAALGISRSSGIQSHGSSKFRCQLCFSLSNCGHRRSWQAQEAATMSCGTWEAAAGAAVGQTSSAHPRSCGCATEQRPQRGRVTAVRGEQRRRAHAAAACETGGRGEQRRSPARMGCSAGGDRQQR